MEAIVCQSGVEILLLVVGLALFSFAGSEVCAMVSQPLKSLYTSASAFTLYMILVGSLVQCSLAGSII